MTRAKWNSVESASFVELLNGNKIGSFIRRIDALNTNEQLSTHVINELTSECSSILIGAAKKNCCIKEIKIGPPNPKTNSKTRHVKQSWFDNECAKLRRQYKRAKNLRHRIKSAGNFRYVHNASKAYKKCKNKQFRLYKKECINKLRALQHSDQKSS